LMLRIIPSMLKVRKFWKNNVTSCSSFKFCQEDESRTTNFGDSILVTGVIGSLALRLSKIIFAAVLPM